MFGVWLLRFLFVLIGYVVGALTLSLSLITAYIISIAKRILRYAESDEIKVEAQRQIQIKTPKFWTMLISSIILSTIAYVVFKNYRLEYFIGLIGSVIISLKDYGRYRDEILYRMPK